MEPGLVTALADCSPSIRGLFIFLGSEAIHCRRGSNDFAFVDRRAVLQTPLARDFVLADAGRIVGLVVLPPALVRPGRIGLRSLIFPPCAFS